MSALIPYKRQRGSPKNDHLFNKSSYLDTVPSALVSANIFSDYFSWRDQMVTLCKLSTRYYFIVGLPDSRPKVFDLTSYATKFRYLISMPVLLKLALRYPMIRHAKVEMDELSHSGFCRLDTLQSLESLSIILTTYGDEDLLWDLKLPNLHTLVIRGSPVPRTYMIVPCSRFPALTSLECDGLPYELPPTLVRLCSRFMRGVYTYLKLTSLTSAVFFGPIENSLLDIAPNLRHLEYQPLLYETPIRNFQWIPRSIISLAVSGKLGNFDIATCFDEFAQLPKLIRFDLSRLLLTNVQIYPPVPTFISKSQDSCGSNNIEYLAPKKGFNEWEEIIGFDLGVITILDEQPEN